MERKLTFEKPADAITIVTDPRRVRQILLNLLSNAIKFGNQKPIVVECVPKEDGGVSISVTDQGEGISDEDQHRIFEEFVQVSPNQQMGTGLGLPISRRLATLLDGSLEVESTPQKGSVFTLTLPAEGQPRVYDPDENQDPFAIAAARHAEDQASKKGPETSPGKGWVRGISQRATGRGPSGIDPAS